MTLEVREDLLEAVERHGQVRAGLPAARVVRGDAALAEHLDGEPQPMLGHAPCTGARPGLDQVLGTGSLCTSAAIRRSVAASPPTSSVVTIDSRHALEVVADLVLGADQRELLDEPRRDGRRGLVLLPVQVEVLDPLRLGLVAEPHGDVVVEVRAARAHPAEVERVHRAQEVGRLLDVVVDDHRHGRRDLEVVPRAPRAGAREPLRERVLVEVRRCAGEEERQPAVADLGRERDVLRALGAEEDRDVLAQRVDRRLAAACRVRCRPGRGAGSAGRRS